MTARPLRLASGLVMLSYLSLHLLSHMLGLVSLALAEQALRWGVWLWHGWPGTLLLYGALALHFALALRTIYQRRNWRLPLVEWLRLWAGFSLPALLMGHAVGTRVAASVYGLDPSYERVVDGLVRSGSEGWQIALLAPGWLHGCLGLWLSLRGRPLARRLRPLLLALLIAVPLLSAAGFWRMSRDIEARPPSTRLSADDPRPQALQHWRQSLLATYLALVAGTFMAGRWANRAARH
jgi:adenylate cyclase